MDSLSKKERFWGCLAHMPIVTIIWISYLTYRQFYNGGFAGKLLSLKMISLSSLPITPILLTVLSIPISLAIKATQKKSVFASSNAQAAFIFNVWLLKCYATSFIFAAIGIFTAIKLIVLSAGIIVFLLSLLCLIQSIMGIFTAYNGKIFHYWRL